MILGVVELAKMNWYINLAVQTGIFVVACVLLYQNLAFFTRLKRLQRQTFGSIFAQFFRVSLMLSTLFAASYVVAYVLLRMGYEVPGELFRFLFFILALSEVSKVAVLQELLEGGGKNKVV